MFGDLRRTRRYCKRMDLSSFDTTSDTTQNATRRNGEQPLARKSAYLSRFCNIEQRLETGVGGLWLRRAQVRVPSVTLSFAGKTQLSMALAESCGSGRAAVELNCDMLAAVVEKSTSRRLIFTTLFMKRSGVWNRLMRHSGSACWTRATGWRP